MGMYKHIRETARNTTPEMRRERLAEWRRSLAVSRVARPTNLTRARSLGYRAKEGIIVTRVRVLRGGRKRPLIKKGRRSKARRMKKILDMNYQTVCENRANKKYPNCEVLNSYWLAKDGKHIWYDVILIDINSPSIIKDKKLSWITKGKHKGRATRGLTSSARKSRGLRNKGKGSEKVGK
ncbi:50S ribosomal protein L15e [Candidatus Woesearchaeota archaeon]|jgi:large subunit ribosomal protein L15e|nr:50S ribosomal protein L15e [Candidatus Woesearchaeota archaeon]MBT5215897.1 50S ribosomal protein L15e [Candidatus Woesearchaeota archaeon]MBT6402230.1 50S ribosomal protein L15e [Candidatus Woesearchaeota archaeon]